MYTKFQKQIICFRNGKFTKSYADFETYLKKIVVEFSVGMRPASFLESLQRHVLSLSLRLSGVETVEMTALPCVKITPRSYSVPVIG